MNPGLFTVATFPFIFGIMYGDAGHGLFILIFGLILTRIADPNLKFLTDYKYLLIALGSFSIYCGLVYNEFFAIPLVSMQTCYPDHKER